MQQSSKRLLAIALALAALLAGYFLLRQPPQTAQEQILGQMESARQAAERRDSSGIMRVISADYADSNGLHVDAIHLYLARALRDSGHVRVAFSPPDVTVTGDTATSTTRVTVRSGPFPTPVYDAPITLHWRREDGTRLFIIPAKVWRIVGADYSGGLPGGE